ncbi:hypothetical protein [Gluconobacter oxydans]|uniref:hypothetical protein n=1 Tax=Gluconobacter oxydans TaxID=442 RepID=UPI000A84CA9C|nr:hypothetical protein [Gluconobacter oxydans]
MKTAFAFAAMLTAAPFLAPLAAGQAHAADNSAPLRFVLIPKTVHPWFDKANNGAQAAATMISQATGRKIEIETARRRRQMCRPRMTLSSVPSRPIRTG